MKARDLQSFQKPSDRNYRSLRRYCYKKKPLLDEGLESIRTKEDMVTIHNGREWATFDGGVETVIGQTDKFLQKVFRTKTPPLQVCTLCSWKWKDTPLTYFAEVLPNSGSTREDHRSRYLILQQLAYWQAGQHPNNLHHILSARDTSHHHVPVDEHGCTHWGWPFGQYDYDEHNRY